MNSIFKYSVLLMVLVSLHCHAQEKKGTYIDDQGVIRWKGSEEEVQGFGVNYSVPFAHSFRSAQRMGIDVKQAMDADIYHLSRLGFDLYRCHLWDTEISDTLGNLLENEHLDAFDYLISEFRSHGFNYVLTPIGYWGNGWPEPDEETPGFSHKYGKGKSLTNQDAIKAAHNYLKQFLNHVNPYTGLAYKDDPNVIAFEVSNEPHHSGEAVEVELFVKNMVGVMKSTGTTTPIFYNMSHGIHFAESYLKGGAEGGTFQWYPTGLVYNKELSGNLLPHVDSYEIPFAKTMQKHGAAKIVYEFDAADVGKSYMYPAMARSFRTAGIQLATQFAYDATFIGHVNTDYNTHYLNLNYTPKKAISLMIAGEVFHEINRYKSFGIYPENTTFGDFQVDYQRDLSLHNGGEKYLHSNNTKQTPKNEEILNQIVGYGNSPLVEYAGRGAYFLDKLDDGIWRLEVQPDAIWVRNPFGKNSPEKQVAVIKWSEQMMRIRLGDLGGSITILPLNEGNTYMPKTENGEFSIRPGTYLVHKNSLKNTFQASDDFQAGELGDFFAPKDNVNAEWLVHEPIENVAVGKEQKFSVEYVGPNDPKEIKMLVQTPGMWKEYSMTAVEKYTFEHTLTLDHFNKEGFLYYDFVVETESGRHISFPTGREGHAFDWDYYGRERYQANVINIDKQLYLFNAFDDANWLVKKWLKTINLVPTGRPAEAELQVNVEHLFVVDNENLDAKPRYDYSFKHFLQKDLVGNQGLLEAKKELVVKARSLNDKPCTLQVALVMNDGSSYGYILELEPNLEEYRFRLSEIKPVKSVIMPRPYPSFLPYYFENSTSEGFDLLRAESLLFSIGPNIDVKEVIDKHGVSIVSVYLE